MSLFVNVEQGPGKNKNNILVITTPKLRQDSRKWIVDNYGKILMVENHSKYKSSVPKESENETDYRVEYRKYVHETLQAMNAIKVKGFGKWYKTFAKAVGETPKI